MRRAESAAALEPDRRGAAGWSWRAATHRIGPVRMLSNAAAGMLAVMVVVTVGAADAGAAMRVVDIPGVSGRSVTMVAAGRLSDGGAIVAGTLTPSEPRNARPRLVIARLRHDGLIDYAFGNEGVVTVQLARGTGRAGTHATSVAVDPARGRSWIGAAVGGSQAGAVLALDGHGRRMRAFGTASVVRFAGNDSAPVALAYGGGRLAVAATSRPCRGCQLLVLDPATGARHGQQALAPVVDAAAASCPQAQVTSLALVGTNRLVLGGSGGATCPARLVIRDGALKPVTAWDPGEPVTRTQVTSAGPPLDLCIGLERDGAVRLVRVGAGAAGPVATTLPKQTWMPVAGSLAGVVPLGDHACGALLVRNGKPARVVQASNGSGKPLVEEVPGALRAGTIYRCNRHVLIVGTRRIGGVDRASVAVTMIARR
jgi:hypothetical protein